MAKLTITDLLELGFDRSTTAVEGTVLIAECSQCSVVCINGVPCHERGCPNQTSECAECGCVVPHGTRLCVACADGEY